MSTKKIKKPTTVALFYWPHNRPFMHDGDEFAAQARQAITYYQNTGETVSAFAIPKVSKLEKRQFILNALRGFKGKSLSRVIFLCHGSPRAFAGFSMSNVGVLGNVIYGRSKMDSAVILYCCLTGKRDDGIADLLSRTSARRVIAHKTRGHTTRNPFKRIFNGGAMADLWPQDKAARKHWIGMFRDSRGSFVFDYVEGFLR